MASTGIGVSVTITTNPELNAFIQKIADAETNFTTPPGSQFVVFDANGNVDHIATVVHRALIDRFNANATVQATPAQYGVTLFNGALTMIGAKS
jgi:hypothetical protein